MMTQPETKKTFNNADIANLITTKQYSLAESILLKILEIYPNNSWALTAIGILYRSTSRPDAAEACYKRAMELEPENAEIYSNYANLLVDQDRMKDAIGYAQKAVDMKPQSALFRKNLAVAQRENKLFLEALENYKICLSQSPDDANLQYDVAFVQLLMRDLDNAWENSECRFLTNKISLPDVKELTRWAGQDVANKTLLVIAEQGFGDTILMTRFLSKLTATGAKVIFSCKPALHDLFKNLGVTIIGLDIQNHGPYDYYIEMMSLPLLLSQKDWMKWPSPPKLHISQAAIEKFKYLSTSITPTEKLKVGIVWSGSVTFTKNEKRAVELDRFLKLSAALDNIQLYSFQKGPRTEDFKKYGTGTIIPLGAQFDNFSETAAAIEHMDLIVMTDSSVCHLAGSLSMPIINLLQFVPYWLYFPEQDSTPLYPSMRFIRQKTSGDWDNVFKKLEKILLNLGIKRAKKKLTHKDVLGSIDKDL